MLAGMTKAAVHRTIFVVDVAGFGRRDLTNSDRLAVRDGLYHAMMRAFHEAGIPWDNCDHEDRGDGALVLIPPEIPKSRFAEALPERLLAALTEHNQSHCEEEQIRLRLALHAGEVHYDNHGVVGTAVNHAFRLLDSAAAKDALNATGGDLAIISSEWFFEEVIQHSRLAGPDCYQQVYVSVKETDTSAWIRLPDTDPATLAVNRRETPSSEGLLRVLAVDDEPHALDDLLHLLRADRRIGRAEGVIDATQALRYIHQALQDEQPLDGVFLDLRMPGLNGLDLARMLARFAEPPGIVFVTAYDTHAVEAFELKAVDYLLKPVRQERLTDAVDRLAKAAAAGRRQVSGGRPDRTIQVELGGAVHFIQQSEVRFVEAQRDYARLHTKDGGFLVRTPISVLAERWAGAGFVQISSSHLVALKHIEELRMDGEQMAVRLGSKILPVSPRYGRQVRDLLVGNAWPDNRSEQPQ
jgi:DNA-binding LytR/AlgR family response regulator